MSGKRKRNPDSVPEVHDTDRKEQVGEVSEETEVATIIDERDLNMAGGTDPGQVRELNEDSWRHEVFAEDFAIAAVADGMGGHDRGEVASSLAIETLFLEAQQRHTKAKAKGFNVQNLKRLLRSSFSLANRSVLECGRENESNMGTTLTTTLVYRMTEALLANVGDTRAYLLRDGALEQITRDHSLVAYLVQMGEITREQARTHPSGNILVRSVGSTDDVDIDIFHITLNPGDRILLATDGLWSELPDEEILTLMETNPDPQEACQAMIDAANAEGGKDNITCVVVSV
ncbi:MAG: Stp1/IreP family PP2C-type Ser/Thr phosphatase [Myxococcota bacterium]|nr:Stp1/IreP family PP2C-type Ser/Thr phosphatase [Myxococcota bacterium]